jgi:hypothetical protein
VGVEATPRVFSALKGLGYAFSESACAAVGEDAQAHARTGTLPARKRSFHDEHPRRIPWTFQNLVFLEGRWGAGEVAINLTC